VTYASRGKILPHSLFHAKAWAHAGFKVNLTVVLDELESFQWSQDLAFASGTLLRLNRGYDFGAFAATIMLLPDLKRASLVAIANDSVYGPFDTFPAMLDRVRKSDADIIGLTESTQFTRHFQSYIMFFRQAAFGHPCFRQFWRRVRTGGRKFVIRNYELTFINQMEKGGLRTSALFPPSDPLNPTLTRWRELINAGFPFIKIQLLRDNPYKVDLSGWDSIVEKRGFDPNIIRRHLEHHHNPSDHLYGT
jgi:lipopolysaccharide biosynthesis protein